MTHAHCTRRRRRSRGQAMAELALILPVIAILFIGVATTATFLSDGQVAGQAVRAGARLAAEDGNGNYGTGTTGCQLTGLGAKDPCIIDDQVIQTVLTTAGNLYDATLNEIDIYEPCAFPGQTSCTGATEACTYKNTSLNGSLQPGDPVDVFTPNGSGGFSLNEPGTDTEYTLDLRNQTHPAEAPIGVKLVYTFRATDPMTFFNFQTSQYATMCLAPSTAGSL